MIIKKKTNKYGISSFLVEKNISEKLCQALLDAGWCCCIFPNKYADISDVDLSYENCIIVKSNCSEKIAKNIYMKI